MSEEEVTNKQIDDKLEEVMEYNQEFGHQDITQAIKLFAKLIFNIRYDINEMKLELLKVFKTEEGKPEPEELKMSPDDLKQVGDDLEECLRDPSRYT